MKLYRFIIVPLLVLSSCSSYYEFNYEFNKNFENGNLQAAQDVLDQNKKIERSKTRFLYYANRGVVSHLLGNYEESNNWLEQAYIFGEDHRKNYLNVAGSYLLNPNLIVYPGEDHEHLMLLYYKSLNYLKMSQFDKALIECRRLNNRLFELGDKYTGKNKYQKDAFIHNLMGIIYDASGDYNNAFIAYRNSLEIYEAEYSEMFSLDAPDQLKEDLMRTAMLAGFPEDLDRYEEKFGYEYEYSPSDGGELVFFWHNGLAPIKDQWSLTFVAIDGGGGTVFFENEDLGLNFPFIYDFGDGDDDVSITDLSGTRVAFPKYVEREPYFNYGDLEVNGDYYTLEKGEDINAIAFKTLNERMLAELGKGLLRVALKKAIEKQVRKENETLGFLVGAFNMASEQADTRNWQTLPHSIHYARAPLKEGENSVEIYTDGPRSEASEKFTFIGKKGVTQFHSYQSLESEVAF
ncbi:MAG: hypothetical protein ABJG78_11700 [Cyclobacteriaceae bacterium]